MELQSCPLRLGMQLSGRCLLSIVRPQHLKNKQSKETGVKKLSCQKLSPRGLALYHIGSCLIKTQNQQSIFALATVAKGLCYHRNLVQRLPLPQHASL